MAGMNAGRAVVRGFRLSWLEWAGRRPTRRPSRPPDALAAFKCWTVLRVPRGQGATLADAARPG